MILSPVFSLWLFFSGKFMKDMTSIILLVSQDTVYVVCGGIITIHFANKYIQANDINDSYKEFNNQDQVNFNGKIVKKTKKEKLNSIMKEKGRS